MNHITRFGPPAATAMPSAPTFRHAARPPTASTCAGTTAGSQREPSRNGTTTGAVRMKTPSTGNTTAAFARITRARSAFIDSIDPAREKSGNRICTRMRLNLFW